MNNTLPTIDDLPRGAKAKIARLAKVCPQTVDRVLDGKSENERVIKAIIKVAEEWKEKQQLSTVYNQRDIKNHAGKSGRITLDDFCVLAKTIVHETINALASRTLTCKQAADEFFDGSLDELEAFLEKHPHIYRKNPGKARNILIYKKKFLQAFYCGQE